MYMPDWLRDALPWVAALALAFLLFWRFTESERKWKAKYIIFILIAFLMTYITVIFSFSLTNLFIPDEFWGDLAGVVAAGLITLYIYIRHPAREHNIVFKTGSAIAGVITISFMFGGLGLLIFFTGDYEMILGLGSSMAVISFAVLIGFLIALKGANKSYKIIQEKDGEIEEQNIKIFGLAAKTQQLTIVNQGLMERVKTFIAREKAKISAIEEDLISILERMGIGNKGKKCIIFVIKFFLKNPPLEGEEIEPTKAYKQLNKRNPEAVRKVINYAIWKGFHKTKDEILRSLYKEDWDENRGHPTPKELIVYLVNYVNNNYDESEIAAMIYEANILSDDDLKLG